MTESFEENGEIVLLSCRHVTGSAQDTNYFVLYLFEIFSRLCLHHDVNGTSLAKLLEEGRNGNDEVPILIPEQPTFRLNRTYDLESSSRERYGFTDGIIRRGK